jgi:pyruvate,water dikinase
MTTALDALAVAPLGGGPRSSPGELGGKGTALDRLIRAGFPVPPTAVITAGAYRHVAGDPAVAAAIARVSEGGDVCAGAVDELFREARVPPELADAIVAAARTVGDGGPVAVRSSATMEDLGGASFAGQYRSVLDVVGDAAVLRAVREVWASLWHPAPCEYRRVWGMQGEAIAMAVVIMRMVSAVRAGVAFTVDPEGPPDQVRVEAVDGLAESLVSGDRTPDVWRLPRRGGHVAALRVPAEIRAAAELALRAEAEFGAPQDVEWAWDGTRIWLVQSRPITTAPSTAGDGCDTPVDRSELTTAGIGEMLPGVLPPLLWDINSFLVEEALRTVLGELDARPLAGSGAHEFVRRIHGRAALNLDLLKAAAATLPGGSEPELERQYFGAASTGTDDRPATDRHGGWWRAARHGIRAAAARRRAAYDGEMVARAIDEVLARRPPIRSYGKDALRAYRHRLIDLGARAMAVELAVAAAAAAAYQQLESTIATYLGDVEAASAVQRVTAGAGALPSCDPATSRSVFAGPSWAETGVAAPVPPGPRRGDRDAARRSLEQRISAKPRWKRVRLLTGQVVDVRMHALRRLVAEAIDGLRRRERLKAAVLALGGEVRRVHLEMGRRLVDAGLLDSPDDVDLLRDEELRHAWHGRIPAPAELSRRRRWVQRYAAEPPLPPRFTGIPDTRRPPGPRDDVLQGWAAGPGRYTGPARVVRDPVADRFDAGDVLVAVATDAGWSPLFLRAGAIVVERGGPLSHAAIVARELGLPAVLNVAAATTALAGRLVTVDGDAGTVTAHPGGGGGIEREAAVSYAAA